MGLPIAIGTKSVSYCELTPSKSGEEFAKDGTILVPVVTPRGANLAQQLSASTASNGANLLAVMTVSYHNMLRLDNGDCDHTSVSVKMQISNLAEALSSEYKETMHRIYLPFTGENCHLTRQTIANQNPEEKLNQDSLLLSSTIIFSSDRRFLTCLIPHIPANARESPDSLSCNSSVVVFQLRKPFMARYPKDFPSTPSYIKESQSAISDVSSTTICPVATHPKILMSPSNLDASNLEADALLDVCSICDARVTCAEMGASLLFMGTRDGSIIASSYRNAMVSSYIYRNNDRPCSIIFMDHLTLWKKEERLIGKLVTIGSDGSVSVYQSEIRLERSSRQMRSDIMEDSASASFLFSVTSQLSTNGHLEEVNVFVDLAKTHVIANSTIKYSHSAKLISASYLALAGKLSVDAVNVQVMGLYEHGQFGPISTIEMTVDDVLENSHATYSAIDNCSKSKQIPPSFRLSSDVDSTPRISDRNVILEYDPVLDCIAISGTVCSPGKGDLNIHFGTIWHWRTNSQGLILGPTKSTLLSKSVKIRTNKLSFATDTSSSRKMSHVLLYDTLSGKSKVQKDLYTVGILSPPHDSNNVGGVPRQSCNLLLSSVTVAYPLLSRISSQTNVEVEWRESMLPRPYIAAHGTPRIAAIGMRGSRSVAIASSRGLCVLNCSNKQNTDVGQAPISFHSGVDNSNKILKQLSKPVISKPRWNLFGNEGTERSFRVIAMAFWEPNFFMDSYADPLVTDDIIVALIEVDDAKSTSIFLSCWLSRNLSLNGQLLVDRTSDNDARSKWGIAIPTGFAPTSLDILNVPERNVDFSLCLPIQRQASVLLFDKSYITKFSIYNLQTSSHTASSLEVNGKGKFYELFGNHGVTSSIGSPADLFIASTSFAYRMTGSSTVDSEPFHTSVIGIFRKIDGGLDSIEVADSLISASGNVVHSAANSSSTDFRKVEICRFYQGESARQYQIAVNKSHVHCFDWILQLANGSLVSWSVPYFHEKSAYVAHQRNRENSVKIFNERKYVNPMSLSLGFITAVGTASSWLQQPSKGTRNDHLLGSVPELPFGYVLGVGQSCKRLRGFANELSFRPDGAEIEILCPGDFLLYPPAFLPSAHSYCVDTIATRSLLHPDFSEYLMPRISKDSHRHSSMMCLQLLILRSTEKLASMKQSNNMQNMIHILLVDSVRKYTTSFEFAAFFVQLGRQLEPSCISILFPLPVLKEGNTEYGETVAHIFEVFLRQGSIRMAVTALPLYSDMKSTQTLCNAVFRLCLDILINLLDTEDPSLFIISNEYKNTARDVFRYSLKLNSTDNVLEHDSDHEAVDDSQQSRYSILCGLPRLWNLRTSKLKQVQGSADKHFSRISGLTKSNDMTSKSSFSAAAVTSKFVENCIFEEPLTKIYGWQILSIIASILLDGKDSGLPICSKEQFTSLACNAAESKTMDRHLLLLKKYMIDCEMQLDPSDAGIILELCLVLLSCESDDININNLIIICIVTSHVSDRITDILSAEPSVNRIWTAYLNARFELSL